MLDNFFLIVLGGQGAISSPTVFQAIISYKISMMSYLMLTPVLGMNVFEQQVLGPVKLVRRFPG